MNQALEAIEREEDTTEIISFSVDENMAIPLPKNFGRMWETRIKDAVTYYEVEYAKWEKAYELYRNCGDEGIKLDTGESAAYHFDSDVEENIIRTNIRTIMRETYMRNPNIEITATPSTSPVGETEDEDDFPRCIEHGLSFIMNKRTFPGINMKPKMQRWILHSQLTNYGIVRLDFNEKKGSVEEARVAVQQIEEKIKKAKTSSDLEALYEELKLAHDNLPVSDERGMALVNVLPHKFIVDPEATLSDLSDAKWVAEEIMLDRDYIKTAYLVKNDDGSYRYKSSQNISVEEDEDGSDREAIEDKVLETVAGATTEERSDIINKNKVQCYYIYDKLMRRTYLYSTENWSAPLWVWEDDMKLSRFFRHFILSFNDTIDDVVQPGEVAYYIGFQKEINRINRKVKKIRDSVFGTLFYNSRNVKEATAEKMRAHIDNPDQVQLLPVDLEEGVKFEDVLHVLLPPAAKYQELFDTKQLRGIIDRQAQTNEVARGGEYKTNTTNDAIQTYRSQEQRRNDMLIGSIEESFDDLGWAMVELFVSKYSKEDIQEMLGEHWSEIFQPMSVTEFNQKYNFIVTSGSIQRPTTEFKKQEALQIAQAIGQVGSGVPMTSTKLIFKMFKRAFSDFFVSNKDWAMLEQEGTANMTKGQTQNGQDPNQPR